MSKLAVKLFEERAHKDDDYLPLLRAIFPDGKYDSSLNENKEFAATVQDILCRLNESNFFGSLQQYFVEEYFLHGKSKEQIGTEISTHMDLMLSDLENAIIRFLRHPKQAKPLLAHNFAPLQENSCKIAIDSAK